MRYHMYCSSGIRLAKLQTTRPVKPAEPTGMPFGVRTHVDPGYHVSDGVEIPYRKRQFLGVIWPLKSIGSVCYGIRSKRDH